MKLIHSILSHIKSSIELNFSGKQIHRILIDKIISVKRISSNKTTNNFNKLTKKIGTIIVVDRIRAHRNELNFKSTIRERTKIQSSHTVSQNRITYWHSLSNTIYDNTSGTGQFHIKFIE